MSARAAALTELVERGYSIDPVPTHDHPHGTLDYDSVVKRVLELLGQVVSLSRRVGAAIDSASGPIPMGRLDRGARDGFEPGVCPSGW
jgi:hypothetical protein